MRSDRYRHTSHTDEVLSSVPILHCNTLLTKDMAAEVVPNQSAVARVSSLPLVSSTYGLVCSVYCTTRDHHPYLRSVCQAAEQGVRAITSVAVTTAMPIIGKLEPQLAIANNLACKGLDQIEKTLPILQQPSDQIVASAKDVVSSATGAVTVARTTVSGTLSGAVDRTRAAVAGGVDKALSTSESLVDQYLPLGPEQMEPEGGPETNGAEGEPSYYQRLGSLSTRLRQRAYRRALARILEAKQRGQQAISQLQRTAGLVEYARRNIEGVNRRAYDMLSSLVEWNTSAPCQPEDRAQKAEVIESRTLALSRSLTQQLHAACSTLASGLQGLPGHIQREALWLRRSASRLLPGLSEGGGGGGGRRARLAQMKASLDNVLDYLVNNTPLNWLVGPFHPRLADAPAATAEPNGGSTHVHAGPPAQSLSASPLASSSPGSSASSSSSSGAGSYQEHVWPAEMQMMDSQQHSLPQ